MDVGCWVGFHGDSRRKGCDGWHRVSERFALVMNRFLHLQPMLADCQEITIGLSDRRGPQRNDGSRS